MTSSGRGYYRTEQALTRAGIADLDLTRGCVVVGPARSGKTTVLDALERTVGGPVVKADGIGRTPGLTFGHLARSDTSGPVTATDDAARMRWTMAARIRERGAILVVEDAHLLDEESAAIIHSLVVHDGVPVYLACAVEPDRPVVEALRALWKDGHLPRAELSLLDEGDVRDYLCHEIDGQVTTRDVGAFMRWSRGEPGTLVDLVASSRRAKQWRTIHGISYLVGRPRPSADLLERLGESTARLPESVQDLVGLFGAAEAILGDRMAEGLPLQPLIETIGMGTLLEAERCDIISADTARIRLTCPVHVDALAHRLRPLHRLRLVADFARAMRTAADTADVSTDPAAEVLRVLSGLLSLASTSPMTVAERREAARSALRMGDLNGCRRLTCGPDATTPIGDVDLAALYTWCLIHVGDAGGLADMTATWRAADSPEWRGLRRVIGEYRCWVRSGSHAFLNRHGPDRAGLLTTLDGWIGADDLSGRWLGLLLAESAVLTGRYRDAHAILGRVAAADADDGLVGTYSRMIDERLETRLPTEARSRDRAEAAVRRNSARGDLGAGAARLACGRAYMRVGRFDEALVELTDAVPLLASTHLADVPAELIRRVSAMTTGDAGTMPGPARPSRTPTSPFALLMAGEFVLDQAWSVAAAGACTTAVDHLLEFAEATVATAPTITIDHLELAMRFLAPGDVVQSAKAAAIIDALASRVEPTWRVRTLQTYRVALTAADGSGLDAVADTYRHAGHRPAAADVHMQAAAAFRAAGRLGQAASSAAGAHVLVQEMGAFCSPAQRLPVIPELTRREQLVTELIAESLTNAQIADRLEVSIRTVEGHLLRACAKFGVHDRRALAALWTQSAGRTIADAGHRGTRTGDAGCSATTIAMKSSPPCRRHGTSSAQS